MRLLKITEDLNKLKLCNKREKFLQVHRYSYRLKQNINLIHLQ